MIRPTLYFLNRVKKSSVALHTNGGNSSMYKKCGFLDFSVPGLDIIECCINSRVNRPNALFTAAPKSPRLVQIRVISQFSNALSKFRLFVLLHNIFLTPGKRSKFSYCELAA